MSENQIVVYQPNETVRLDVRLENETVWLNRHQMAQLFGRDVKTIGKHIANALREELSEIVMPSGLSAVVANNAPTETSLCCPTVAKFATTAGIFYKPGVKANVIFFDKKPASPERQTKEVWIYDFRTNIHFTLKQNPMADGDLKDFISCYNPANRQRIRRRIPMAAGASSASTKS